MSRNSTSLPIAALIASPSEPTMGSPAVDKVLHAIRDHLGMDVAFVSEFRNSDRIFRHMDALDRTPIHAGDYDAGAGRTARRTPSSAATCRRCCTRWRCRGWCSK
jgi:hypothetical protein